MYGKMLWKMRTFPNRGDIIIICWNMLILLESMFKSGKCPKSLNENHNIRKKGRDFNSNVYYTNPDYLRCSYLEGKMLE